jgi:hypothetical protein
MISGSLRREIERMTVECGGEFWWCQRSGMDKSSVFRPNTLLGIEFKGLGFKVFQCNHLLQGLDVIGSKVEEGIVTAKNKIISNLPAILFSPSLSSSS